MIVNAIYRKEWFKLKRYAFALMSLAAILGGYFCLDLVGQFASIEPESMMWYRFSHLGDKPYRWLLYGFVLTGGIIAVCQFVPEVMGKRVRILTHLPVSLDKVIVTHVLAGSTFVLIVNGIICLFVVLILNRYYPVDVVQVSVKDMLFGQLPAISLYLGLVAVIVESEWRQKSIKFTVAVLATFILLKEQYQLVDIGWVFLLAWFVFSVKDSFLSIKTRRLENRAYIVSVPVILICLSVVSGLQLYKQYSVSHTKFYLFYSSMLNDFVYQENAPKHTFFYGTLDTKMDRAQFEGSLPFVYWKNLDIQGKLPVLVEGKSYNKAQIRHSRMSLQYDPTRLRKPEVTLYPFFNPISDKGSIRFPENAFSLKSDRIEVYAAETARLNKELTDEVNGLAQNQGVVFPVKEVWGKTTNMKPFDWGYFIKDSSERIFNLNRADNTVHLTPVLLPEEIGHIVYIQVSENRHKKFYGYAISARSKVYLVSYPDYRFIPLEMKGFDYQTMSFQLLSDPLYYVMRYNDGEKYSAVRFSKNFTKIDSVELH